MSSSVTPEQLGAESVSPEALAPGDQSGGLNVLKSLSEKRVNRDGTQAKRRGPKPDSKPALTRRQELNRQAQRTHRERKELYIKALEEEVLRLKEIFSTIAKEKDSLAEENRMLREAMAQQGMASPPGLFMDSASMGTGFDGSLNTDNLGATDTTQFSQSYGSTPATLYTQQSATSETATSTLPTGLSDAQIKEREQAGIDFILTLERPCMRHLPFLTDLAAKVEEFPCGHALMGSCPPKAWSELASSPAVPFSTAMVPGDSTAGQQTWDIDATSLQVLLNLSSQFDLDGELTPVMAWGMLRRSEKFNDLSVADISNLAKELSKKTRCYGFGAVMEEFEVRDAIQSLSGNMQQLVF